MNDCVIVSMWFNVFNYTSHIFVVVCSVSVLLISYPRWSTMTEPYRPLHLSTGVCVHIDHTFYNCGQRKTHTHINTYTHFICLVFSSTTIFVALIIAVAATKVLTVHAFVGVCYCVRLWIRVYKQSERERESESWKFV